MICCLHGKSGLAAVMGLAAGLAFGAGTLVGASEKPLRDGVIQPEADGAQPEMDFDPEAMMAAMAEANKKNEHHAHLAEMVGVWDGHLTAEMPGGPTFESRGIMTNEMVMDGRFLRGTWEGDMWGIPFTGISLTGYSNIDGEHQAIWYDSTANRIWYTTGSCDDDGVITMHGSETDPMSGTEADYKDIIRMHGEDRMTFERVYVTPEGETPGFKIEYTRRS